LLSGGLGGIGSQIARMLLREFDARLLLLGRTKLQTSERTPTILPSSLGGGGLGVRGQLPESILPSPPAPLPQGERGEANATAERLQTLAELQQIGQVRYEAVDIGDEAGVRAAVAR